VKHLFLALILVLCAIHLGCLALAGEVAIFDEVADTPHPTSIAVVPFPLASGTPAPPVDVAEIIRADLASTGRFFAMPSEDLPSRPTGLADIHFEQWRQADVDFVVVGLVAIVHDGGHEIEFRVVDIRKGVPIVGFVVPSGPDRLEQSAQRIARIIDQRLTRSASSTAVPRRPQPTPGA
jgi:TolB protein